MISNNSEAFLNFNETTAVPGIVTPYWDGADTEDGISVTENLTKNWQYYVSHVGEKMVIVSVFNVIGNATILLLILCRPTFRKPANYLIGNLSAASLLYMTAVMVHRLERSEGLWSYGPRTCRIIPVLHKIPGSVVSLTLMSISSDRSRIIRNPFESSKITPVGRIITIWLLSVFIVLPYGIAKRFEETKPEHYKCIKVPLWNNPLYNILYGLVALAVIHIIPAFVLLKDVCKMLSTMKFLSLWPRQVWKNEDRRVTLMRNACIYALIFTVCWLPTGICRFFLDLPPGVISRPLRDNFRYYWEGLRYVGYVYVALHPLLLFLLSHDLRQHISLCCV
ncbi:unnamed protein product [Allacma fusca]|uniref:G-protein coupled receptors family 1 profile domain-containing protein n=1 Tax=Allacma fusca TaxID=39272 RepID=A0A8J2JDQ3_9HEXA|nr:unnamed protein product [Allacma fusca]